ncbi:MAG: methyltransferase type 11 [Candidatus Nitrosocosmicus sp.]|nr:methyltransferase type 11 [Candidatus Nitrosocosmicus sp.]
MLRKFIKLALLSSLRHNPTDVVNIYDTFSDLMNITTGGKLLNFGYWDKGVSNPFDAQIKLTKLLGELGRFSNAKNILDLGSGYSVPALTWLHSYPTAKIYCINLSLNQIIEGKAISDQNQFLENASSKLESIESIKDRLFHINSTSTFLAHKNGTMDRIVALESAQHFSPFVEFVREAWRILKHDGMFVIAIPVLVNKPPGNLIPLYELRKLGILNITWASQHYKIEFIEAMIKENGFKIDEVVCIGSNVYQPLANYYNTNRINLRKMILNHYPNFLEIVLYRSISKMKTASERGIIDYALFKAVKK